MTTKCSLKFCEVHKKTLVLESFRNLKKKRLKHRYFPVNFFEIFKSSYFVEHVPQAALGLHFLSHVHQVLNQTNDVFLSEMFPET